MIRFYICVELAAKMYLYRIQFSLHAGAVACPVFLNTEKLTKLRIKAIYPICMNSAGVNSSVVVDLLALCNRPR